MTSNLPAVITAYQHHEGTLLPLSERWTHHRLPSSEEVRGMATLMQQGRLPAGQGRVHARRNISNSGRRPPGSGITAARLQFRACCVEPEPVGRRRTRKAPQRDRQKPHRRYSRRRSIGSVYGAGGADSRLVPLGRVRRMGDRLWGSVSGTTCESTTGSKVSRLCAGAPIRAADGRRPRLTFTCAWICRHAAAPPRWAPRCHSVERLREPLRR